MDGTAIVVALIGLLGTVLGSVLAWMMGRIDRRIDRVDRSLERFSKAMLLEIVSRPGVALSVTREADALLADMARDREREAGA